MSDNKPTSTNVVWHGGHIVRADRERSLNQKGCVLWFTGLSGSGKSTVACCLEQQLEAAGHHTYLLDGDNIRHGLNGDLGFTEADRTENIRRIGEVAALFADAGLITLTAFISPFRADRNKARSIIASRSHSSSHAHSDSPTPPAFIEVFIDTPLDICEARDPKKLYRKARAGEIPHFTGISSPYEAPENPEITIHTADLTPEAAASQIMEKLRSAGVIPAPNNPHP